MCRGNFGEGEDFVDDTTELSCFDMLHDVQEIATSAHGRAQNGLLTQKQESEVHFHIRASRGAAKNQLPALRQRALVRDTQHESGPTRKIDGAHVALLSTVTDP